MKPDPLNLEISLGDVTVRLPAGCSVWAARIGGFFFTVLEVCLLGALLGLIVFPVVGALFGNHRSRDELIVLGVKTGGFFFLVWAPGLALVRMFVRAAKNPRRT